MIFTSLKQHMNLLCCYQINCDEKKYRRSYRQIPNNSTSAVPLLLENAVDEAINWGVWRRHKDSIEKQKTTTTTTTTTATATTTATSHHWATSKSDKTHTYSNSVRATLHLMKRLEHVKLACHAQNESIACIATTLCQLVQLYVPRWIYSQFSEWPIPRTSNMAVSGVNQSWC